nr:GDP dissociation inhibitor [Tanacetum cinerariifolium]
MLNLFQCGKVTSSLSALRSKDSNCKGGDAAGIGMGRIEGDAGSGGDGICGNGDENGGLKDILAVTRSAGGGGIESAKAGCSSSSSSSSSFCSSSSSSASSPEGSLIVLRSFNGGMDCDFCVVQFMNVSLLSAFRRELYKHDVDSNEFPGGELLAVRKVGKIARAICIMSHPIPNTNESQPMQDFQDGQLKEFLREIVIEGETTQKFFRELHSNLTQLYVDSVLGYEKKKMKCGAIKHKSEKQAS